MPEYFIFHFEAQDIRIKAFGCFVITADNGNVMDFVYSNHNGLCLDALSFDPNRFWPHRRQT
jgi:hypothetical protein